jgi:hypothetical protein
LGSVLYGLRTHILIIQATDDQDRDAGRGQQEPVEGLKTPAIGQGQIGYDRYDSPLAKSFEGAGQALNPFDLKWADSWISEHLLNQHRISGIVFDEEQIIVCMAHVQ